MKGYGYKNIVGCAWHCLENKVMKHFLVTDYVSGKFCHFDYKEEISLL
jgi:hypothetical protein